MKILVDLSAQIQAGASPANVKQAVNATPLKACGKQAEAKVEAQTQVSVKANGTQVNTTNTVSLGARVEAKVKVNTVSSKANGKLVLGAASTVSLQAKGKQIAVEVKPVANGKTNRNLVHGKHATPSQVVVKESIVKVRETLLVTQDDGSEDEASTLSEDYRRASFRKDKFLPDWAPGVVCDLCERGVSLYLGAWYSWCCGNPSRGCSCSLDEIQ